MGDLESCTDSTLTVGDKIWNLTGPPMHIYTKRLPDYSVAYTDGYKTFGQDYVHRNGQCQPTNEYQWGFSSLLLFAFCMVTCFATVLLMILYYDAWWNGQADRYDISISMYRDVLDLADKLRTSYDADVDCMPADALEKEIRRHPIRVGLDTEDLLRSRGQPFNSKVAAECKKASRYALWTCEDVVGFIRKRDTSRVEERMMSIGHERHDDDTVDLTCSPTRLEADIP